MPPTPLPPSWTPLLIGRESRAALDWAQELAAAVLRYHRRSDRGPSLFRGQAGAALFLAEAAKAGLGASYAEAAQALASQALEKVRDPSTFPGLFPGVTGVAAVVDLIGTGIKTPGLLLDLDRLMLQRVRRPRWSGDFDHVAGLAGMGQYALGRLPRTSARHLALAMVGHLERLAVPLGAALFWRGVTPPLEAFELSMAHGVAGVLAFATAAHQAKVATQACERLIRGSIAAIRTAVVPSARPQLPRHWQPHPTAARASWCSGAAGTAPVLFRAARAVNDTKMQALALALADAAPGPGSAQAHIDGPGLCHGAMGNALCYARLAQSSQVDRYRERARLWVKEAFRLRRPEQGLGGVSLELNGKRQPEAEASFLMGAPGVGLALLALATDHPPQWDRLLGLSVKT